MSTDFSHFDDSGQARMVDVGGKPLTERVASATCVIHLRPNTLSKILEGSMDKGDVLGIARIAGIMAAKKTSELIPLCHPLGITSVDVSFRFPDDRTIEIGSIVKTTGQTGVEMEAMTCVAVCGLTIYDMCKSVDREMSIGNLCLKSKSGGKSGNFNRDNDVDESSDRTSI